MDVGVWLRELGLAQYEAAFRDNEIDAEILPRLTADDLKELGVASIGHRRKLLDAAAALTRSAPPETAAAPPAPPIHPRDPRVTARVGEDYAERRPITVMFCDLVGSTSLAARLDAEDWRNLVNSYLDRASAAVTGLGGHVLKKLGDGLMALFGYPQAQENDAERAVRAALAIQRALSEINARNAGKGAPELSARIGLESGPVVVDATGEVFGDAPNVAARVQGAAEPGSVLVTLNVQRQVAGLFVAEERGPHELKGVPQPVNLFRIVRASGAARRGGGRALTPFVGREEELGLLMRRWERARGGEGQLVLVVGEPGLGKSRLMEEFRARIAEAPHTWVEWSASQLLQNTPLHPLAEWGRQRFGGADVPAEQRLADLESSLRQVKVDADEGAPLLAPLLDIPLPPDRAARLSPEETRRKQLAAIVSWIMAGARTQPVALAFEDLQWADPTSIDVLRALAERGAQAPLFLVATSRPEFRPPWDLRSHHGVISLSPLEQAQVLRMVGEIASRHALSKDVIEGVSQRTGGVPLFIEEVTRLLLERGDEGGAQAIPLTLQQSLAARLDRLGEARETAQIGAVLGREFSYRLLRAVAGSDNRVSPPPPGHSPSKDGRPSTPYAAVPLPRAAGEDAPNGAASFLRIAGEGDQPKAGGGGARFGGGVADPGLQTALERLAEADILFVEGAPPSATYRFKHALIQDAAYDSLLKSRRQALHRRAAEALRDDSERAAAEPEVIAHHFTQGGLDDAAIEWWGRAGDQALRRSAFQEAIAHLGKAIAMADKGVITQAPVAAETKGERKPLKTITENYARAVMLGKGFSAPETSAAFARVRGDADALPSTRHFDSAHAEWIRHFIGGDLSVAQEIAERFVQDAQSKGLTTEICAGLRMLGSTRLSRGQFVRARSDLELALNSGTGAADREARLRFAAEPRALAQIFLAIARWNIGDLQEAIALSDMAVAAAEASNHPPTLATVRLWRGILNLLRRKPEAVRADANIVLALGRQHGMPVYSAGGAALLSWARACAEPSASDLTSFRDAIRDLAEAHIKQPGPLFHGLLAELELETGRIQNALAAADEALSLARESWRLSDVAFLYRLRGEILLKLDRPTAAEDAFHEALAIAKEQGARTYGLLAALALARLYQSTGRPVDAHAVLTPALEGWPSPLSLSGEGSGVRASADLVDAAGPSSPALLPEGEGSAAEMPELREAEALLAALSETDEVKAANRQRRRASRLQVAYGNALIAARGYGAPESTEAFARARESASGDKDASDRLAADYGLWLGSYVRGELSPMRAHAQAFLNDVGARLDSPEAGIAYRIGGVTHQFAGEFVEARNEIERGLALFEAGRDDDLAFRFGLDAGVTGHICLAIASWPLGDIDRAISHAERAHERLAGVTHVGTLAFARHHSALFELMRRNRARVERNAIELARLAREHDLTMFRAFAVFLHGWLNATGTTAGAGLEDMRGGVALLREQNVVQFDGLLKAALAEAETQAGDPDRGLALIDEALTTAALTGYRAFESELHRVRGHILLKREPPDLGPAEDAYRTAIAVATEQDARSYELIAALALARLYQSTGHPLDAHAVLAPALEGFPSLLAWGEGGGRSPPDEGSEPLTPHPSPARERGDAPAAEMPELREAETLLAALRETDEVKTAIAQQKRRFDLQTAYGQALLWSKGFAAEETKEAFDRARELAGPSTDAARLFSVRYEQFTRGFIGGDMRSARAIADDFLRDAERGGYAMEAVVGRRILGSVCLFQGDLRQAQTHLERVLADYSPDRDAEARLRFGMDTRIVALLYLAIGSWHLGEVRRCRLLIEEAVRLAEQSGHPTTLAFAYNYQTVIEARRGDPAAAQAVAERTADHCREHGLEYFFKASQSYSTWARARSLGSRANPAELAEDLEDQKRRDSWIGLPFQLGLLGEIEARTGNADRALARIDEGLAIAEKTGERYIDSYLHRIRGDVLLKRNPDDPAPAEDAYRTAIAIAKEQGARSYVLIASLALAKLYRSMGRPAEAHAVLAPALERWPSLLPWGEGGGRSPPDEGIPDSDGAAAALTPDPSPARERGDAFTEMPELREAVALLAALG